MFITQFLSEFVQWWLPLIEQLIDTIFTYLHSRSQWHEDVKTYVMIDYGLSKGDYCKEVL